MFPNIAVAHYPNGSSNGLYARTKVSICGSNLTVDDVARVARSQAQVQLTNEETVLDRVHAAHAFIMHAAEVGDPIYGVTSGFGGMANVVISPEDAAELQNNLLRFHKAAT